MTETTNTGGNRRPRRSTRVSQRLERARQRNAEQLTSQREREQRVDTALAEFAEAAETIETEQASCDEKVAALHREIEQLQQSSRERVADEHARQARSALTIQQAGRNAAQVAELLELRSGKEARRLIANARDTEDSTSNDPAEADVSGSAPNGDAETQSQSPRGAEKPDAGLREQAQLGGIDRQQHSPHPGFVPSAAADGGRQSA